MSKVGSLHDAQNARFCFCHVRKKKRGSFSPEEDLLPKKKSIGKFFPDFFSPRKKIPGRNLPPGTLLRNIYS